MAIDPLDWAGDRLIVLGPSFLPQPYPTLPVIRDFGNFAGGNKNGGQNWTASGGEWQVRDNTIFQNSMEEAAARLKLDYRHFLLEVEIKALENRPGRFGFGLDRGGAAIFSFLIEPENTLGRLTWLDEVNSNQEQILPLPENFNPTAYHLLRLEVQARQVCLWFDGVPVNSGPLNLGQEADYLRFISLAAPAAFTGFALTPGFETLSSWKMALVRRFQAGSRRQSAPPLNRRGMPLLQHHLSLQKVTPWKIMNWS